MYESRGWKKVLDKGVNLRDADIEMVFKIINNKLLSDCVSLSGLL